MSVDIGKELQPCPFCGSTELDAAFSTNKLSDYIMCNGEHGCGAMISREDTKDGDLIAAWNRRAAQPAPIRDWSEDFAHENGNYENLCSACQCVFYGHKRRSTCKACATQPAPIPAQTSFDAAWDSIDWDVWRMQPIRELVRHLHGLTAGNALTEEAKDAAPKVERNLKVARDALQRLEATLSVLHEDHDPIMAAIITSVALVLDGDIEAAREAINDAIASHIKAGQAGKEEK